jgi:hypothetical protein
LKTREHRSRAKKNRAARQWPLSALDDVQRGESPKRRFFITGLHVFPRLVRRLDRLTERDPVFAALPLLRTIREATTFANASFASYSRVLHHAEFRASLYDTLRGGAHR